MEDPAPEILMEELIEWKSQLNREKVINNPRELRAQNEA